MIGVVVPAHNEEVLIGRCLQKIQVAARSSRLHREPVHIVVVLDACTDRTGPIALEAGAHSVVEVDARNVGVARALGAQVCLTLGCRWLAFTDADSEVSEGWLADQLHLQSDAVCGTISVSDWGPYGMAMQEHFAKTYTDADGHRHIHGANLGVSADAYRTAGGFLPLSCSEDVALVRALEEAGASIAWSARPRVSTSPRKDFRAPGGFGETLLRVEASQAGHDRRCD